MKPFLAYLQLMRLPNVFTAMADILMGYLVVHAGLTPLIPFLLLLMASSSLYTAGVVLNDLWDYEVDSRERPDRPLPSGRVSRTVAKRLAIALVLIGLGAAWSAGLTSGLVALVLFGAILLYDGQLKATRVGPIVMGACRFLNVILGMSTISSLGQALPVTGLLKAPWPFALAIGTYIAGVTWLARREAETSRRSALIGAAGTINSSFVFLAALGATMLIQRPFQLYYWLLLAVIVWTVDRRVVEAISDPTPTRVQFAVKTSILSLIPLDATIVCGVLGPWWAAAVLLLVVPALVLGHWVYST